MTKKKTKFRVYRIKGTAIDEAWITRNRLMIEEYTRDDMREHGFIPVLDLPTTLKWDWDQDKDVFNYTLEYNGMYVGKRKAKNYVGILSESSVMIPKEGTNVEIVRDLLSS